MAIETEINLETKRLLLRRFRDSDAEAIAEMCADRRVALNTMSIPHPYTIEDAHEFLERSRKKMDEGESTLFAIEAKSGGAFIGSISLMGIQVDHQRAELGYALGVAHWGHGYATEASRAIVDHGFRDLGLRKIFACYFPRNPASGRVLEKLGFVEEGRLREHVFKWDTWLDKVVLSQLRSEWARDRGVSA